MSDLEENRNENLQRNAARLRELGIFPEPQPAPTKYVKMHVVTILKYSQD